MIRNFDELFDQLRAKPKKRLVAAWAIDDHTINAVALAVKAGIVDGTLVGDQKAILEVCKNENIDMDF